MKTQLNRLTGRRTFRLGVPLTATLLLLAALPLAAADTPYTATGWVIGVPVPGIWCTNALGQVGFRGNAHLAQVVGTDPRLTGRRTIYVDGAAQADGSSIIYGPAYQEVGTWNATGTNFTATGGMWEISYRGTMGADGSLRLHLFGSGWGGTIDGLRLDESMTREAGPNLDPAIAYQYTGTIKPPPVNTSQVLDNFNDNSLAGWVKLGPGQVTLLEANQQFTVRGYWPGVTTVRIEDTFAWGTLPVNNWSLTQGQFIEWRVDLVGMNENADMAALCTGNTNTMGIYLFLKWRDFVGVGKWVGNHVALLSFEAAPVKNTNVVLVLAQTLVNDKVVLITRLLDKDNGDAVLFQRVVGDTPAADPTVSSAQVAALSGMQLTVGVDIAGTPYTNGNVVDLESWQYNNGSRAMAEVTFDNLELRTSDIPPVGIEGAVRLSWPLSATLNYVVEAAPTLQGPWLPVQNTAVPDLQQMTVPANDIMGFFRLRQSP